MMSTAVVIGAVVVDEDIVENTVDGRREVARKE